MIAAYPLLSRAQAAFREGRHEEAAQHVMNHVRQHPGEPRGLALLGAVASATGALVQGEMFLRKALSRSPGDRDVLRELASCLNQQERPDEALALFQKLRDPGNPSIDVTISLLLDKLGKHEQARDILDRLVREFATRPNVWITLGHHLRAAGNTDEAIEAYRRAIAIEPELGDAWWGIASIKKRILVDSDIREMQEIATVAVDPRNLAPLHFALARAFHDKGDYAQAFHHYSEANRFWAESLDYNADQLTEEVSESARLFTPEFFARTRGPGAASAAPIFIVSLPRSGSTLLEQMLDRHSQIEALGELTYIPALLRSMMESATRAGIRSVPEAVARLAPQDRTKLGEEYLRRASLHRKSNAPFFVDKLPHNWSNSVFIRQILPNAKIIDIRRDAMTCCWSNFSHSFSRAHASSFTLDGIGRAYADYVRFMADLDRSLPDLMHHLRYEDLVEDPEPRLRAILAHLQLPWEDSVLRFHESGRTVRTPSAEQVRRPLNREGMDTWRPYAEWLQPLRTTLGPLASED